jgi:biotin synthase
MSIKSSNKNFLSQLLTYKNKKVNNLKEKDIKELLKWDLYDLLYLANKVREEYCGNKVRVCSIVNAKSGRCSENCRFCAQSGHNNANIEEYSLKKPEEILKTAKEVEKNGSKRFGIVTSGNRIYTEKDWESVFKTVKLLIKETSLVVDASLGSLDLEHARLLKSVGLKRYHHNLETSEKYFKKICTTHTFNDRLKTVKVVKEAGLELCCGCLFGLGEKWSDRISLAFTLKEIDPDCIPLNFLYPVQGTPLENKISLTPKEILKIIAIFRIILPKTDISICGGRAHNLRSLQSWMFYAGANATMIGNYLTTQGNPPEKDLQMIEDLEFLI